MNLPEKDAWNSSAYNANAAFVSVYGEDLLSILAPKKGEKILDVGCGEGTLGIKIQEAGAKVTGIDASASMVAAAREKGLDAYVMDGADMSYRGEFDAVFSNAALHWVKPPEKAVEGIYNALKPGGRFIAELGGEGNVSVIRLALIDAVSRRGLDGNALDPWYFPSARTYKWLLETQGFAVEHCELFARPTPIKTGIEGWLATFGDSFLSSLPEQEKNTVVNEVREAAKPMLYSAENGWVADYVRLRIKALKK